MESDPYTQALRRIPAGRTVTFAELACLAGRPQAARAAGRSIASIPTDDVRAWHRVVRADGAHAPDPERAAVQIERLRHEGARPRADETVSAWARRRRARFVGAWRDRRAVCTREDGVDRLDPLRVEALRDEEQTIARGFAFGAAPRQSPQRARTEARSTKPARRK